MIRLTFINTISKFQILIFDWFLYEYIIYVFISLNWHHKEYYLMLNRNLRAIILLLFYYLTLNYVIELLIFIHKVILILDIYQSMLNYWKYEDLVYDFHLLSYLNHRIFFIFQSFNFYKTCLYFINSLNYSDDSDQIQKNELSLSSNFKYFFKIHF